MARAVIAALVLCAAVMLVAAAHAAGRVIEYQALEADTGLSPLSPAASADVAADADAGGVVRTLGVLEDGREMGVRAIGDVVWFVLDWAKQAAFGGERRKAAF